MALDIRPVARALRGSATAQDKADQREGSILKAIGLAHEQVSRIGQQDATTRESTLRSAVAGQIESRTAQEFDEETASRLAGFALSQKRDNVRGEVLDNIHKMSIEGRPATEIMAMAQVVKSLAEESKSITERAQSSFDLSSVQALVAAEGADPLPPPATQKMLGPGPGAP